VNIAPQPLVARTQVDTGGAVIRRVIILRSEGHIIREYGNINQIRFMVERPGSQPGVHVVEVVTDFDSVRSKLLVQ
jgi:hypothetical protein